MNTILEQTTKPLKIYSGNEIVRLLHNPRLCHLLINLIALYMTPEQEMSRMMHGYARIAQCVEIYVRDLLWALVDRRHKSTNWQNGYLKKDGLMDIFTPFARNVIVGSVLLHIMSMCRFLLCALSCIILLS